MISTFLRLTAYLFPVKDLPSVGLTIPPTLLGRRWSSVIPVEAHDLNATHPLFSNHACHALRINRKLTHSRFNRKGNKLPSDLSATSALYEVSPLAIVYAIICVLPSCLSATFIVFYSVLTSVIFHTHSLLYSTVRRQCCITSIFFITMATRRLSDTPNRPLMNRHNAQCSCSVMQMMTSSCSTTGSKGHCTRSKQNTPTTMRPRFNSQWEWPAPPTPPRHKSVAFPAPSPSRRHSLATISIQSAHTRHMSVDEFSRIRKRIPSVASSTCSPRRLTLAQTHNQQQTDLQQRRPSSIRGRSRRQRSIIEDVDPKAITLVFRNGLPTPPAEEDDDKEILFKPLDVNNDDDESIPPTIPHRDSIKLRTWPRSTVSPTTTFPPNPKYNTSDEDLTMSFHPSSLSPFSMSPHASPKNSISHPHRLSQSHTPPSTSSPDAEDDDDVDALAAEQQQPQYNGPYRFRTKGFARPIITVNVVNTANRRRSSAFATSRIVSSVQQQTPTTRAQQAATAAAKKRGLREKLFLKGLF